MAFSRPTALPIDPAGTPDRGFGTMRVTSPYGPRSIVLADGTRLDSFHDGLDIGNARLGDRVTAIGGGTVIHASTAPLIPWSWPAPADKVGIWGPSWGGRVVVIDHGDGWSSHYAHLGAFRVAKGERVTRGKLIGLIGDSGSAMNQGHLHFGIRNEARADNGHHGFIDPWPLIKDAATESDVLGDKTAFLDTPFRARIAGGVALRTDTRISDDTLDAVTDAAIEVTVVGRASGAEFRGSRNWHVFGVNDKGLRCVHSALTERVGGVVTTPTGDCSEEVAAARAPLVQRITETEGRITAAIETLRGSQ